MQCQAILFHGVVARGCPCESGVMRGAAGGILLLAVWLVDTALLGFFEGRCEPRPANFGGTLTVTHGYGSGRKEDAWGWLDSVCDVRWLGPSTLLFSSFGCVRRVSRKLQTAVLNAA